MYVNRTVSSSAQHETEIFPKSMIEVDSIKVNTVLYSLSIIHSIFITGVLGVVDDTVDTLR